jgi:sphingomyelin phosphodiesterase 2
VFSKYPIVDVNYYRFSVNGKPYKIHHGDWCTGGLVGLAQIKYNDYNIHAYVTHVIRIHSAIMLFLHRLPCGIILHHVKLVANYALNEQTDEYLAHRLCQAFELSRFINVTSSSADFVLLMADLNLTPNETGFAVLKQNSNLNDTFVEAKVGVEK